MAGCFVTFEGIDSGKSTQVALLAAKLSRRIHHVVTREPGGALGELRALLLDPENAIAPLAEMLLLAADRAQHVEQVIRPALDEGAFVLCDRYVDSSRAYQGAAGVPSEAIEQVNRVATGGLEPDITFVFDIDPGGALPTGGADRFEKRSATTTPRCGGFPAHRREERAGRGDSGRRAQSGDSRDRAAPWRWLE